MEVALYVRTSSMTAYDQDLEAQLSTLHHFAASHAWGVTRTYIDHAASEEPEPSAAWQQMLADAAKDSYQGILVVRLAAAFRSVKHMYDTLTALDAYNIAFLSLEEGLDTRSMASRQTLRVIAGMAIFETEGRRQRICAGIERARGEGKRIGRPPITSRPEVGRLWPLVATRIKRGEISVGEAARILRIGKTTVRRLLSHAEGTKVIDDDDSRPPPSEGQSPNRAGRSTRTPSSPRSVQTQSPQAVAQWVSPNAPANRRVHRDRVGGARGSAVWHCCSIHRS